MKKSNDTYSCVEYPAEKPIVWHEIKQLERKEFDSVAAAQRITMDLLLLAYEVRVATEFTTAPDYRLPTLLG